MIDLLFPQRIDNTFRGQKAALLLQFVAALLLRTFHPLVRVGSPPAAYVNFSLLTLLVVGWILSLWKRKDVAAGGQPVRNIT